MWKTCWKILKPYQKFIYLLIAVAFLASLFDGISAGMLVPLLGSLQAERDYSQLPYFLQILATAFSRYTIERQILFSVGMVVLTVLLKNLFCAVSLFIATWLSSKVMSDLRIRCIDILMQVGIGFYTNTRAGDLVERTLSNTATVQGLVVHGAEFIANFASTLVLFVFLLIFSWKLTLIISLFAALITWALTFYIRFLAKIARRNADISRDLSSLLYESINGIRVIRSFASEERQTLILKNRVEQHRKTSQVLSYAQYLIHILMESIGVVAIGIMFLLAMAIYKTDSSLIITQLVPFVYVLTKIIPLVKVLNQTRESVTSKLPFLVLVYELLRLDDKPLIAEGTQIFNGLKQGIELQNVSFSYENCVASPSDSAYPKSNCPAETKPHRPILDNISLQIPQGKTTAIVGESGAGKSTIINLLMRFYDPQQGSILIDGKPLTSFQTKSYRQSMGVVSQNTFVFNDTVRNNIAFGALAETTTIAIVDAATRAGAHEFISRLPHGYDTILGDDGVRLSGGQRQRISIARAILKNPEILIFDEATSSLDSRTEDLVHRAISELGRDRTVVIIAHRLSTVKEADRIIVLKQGRVAEIGRVEQLIANRGEYYRLAQNS